MEMLKAYYNKAKQEAVLFVLFAVGLILVLLTPFLTYDLFNESYNISMDDQSGFFNLLIVLGTIAALVMNAFVVYSAKNATVKTKFKMMTTLVSFAVSAVSAFLVLAVTIYRKDDGLDFGYGFFLSLVTFAAAAVLSGMEVSKNKDLAKQVMGDVKSDVKAKVDSQVADKPTSTK